MRTFFVIALAVGCALGMTPAHAANLGDVNNDGAINVLDVQAAIAQALQLVPQMAEADLDGSGTVDVTDVQNFVNTALGTGGLLQRLQGRLDAAADVLAGGVKLVAVSQEGDKVVVTVNTATGDFTITLPVKKQWMFVFVDGSGTEAGTIEFPVNGDISTLLPLLDLSQCDILNLGNLNFGEHVQAPLDIRELLGSINKGDVLTDEDGNGVPDFIDDLLDTITAANIPGLDFSAVIANLKTCVEDQFNGLNSISLVDEDGDGTPDWIEPIIQCLHDALVQIGLPAQWVDMGVEFITRNVGPWLAHIDLTQLADANGNGVPDKWEAFIGHVTLPAWIDADGNGIPDFLEKK